MKNLNNSLNLRIDDTSSLVTNQDLKTQSLTLMIVEPSQLITRRMHPVVNLNLAYWPVSQLSLPKYYVVT